jgi:hypothetical protein
VLSTGWMVSGKASYPSGRENAQPSYGKSINTEYVIGRVDEHRKSGTV